MPILPAPTARMNSRITINKADKGGFVKAEARAGNQLDHLPAQCADCGFKTDKMRLFTPETWQKARVAL